MNVNITKTFAEFIHTAKYEDIPTEVIDQAKDFILDNIGCTLGSYAVPEGKIIANTKTVFGSGEESIILGNGKKASPFAAAFVDTKLCNFIDSDETLYNFYHIGGSPFYAALHTAEVVGASGRDVILATILGYEYAYRFCKEYALVQMNADGTIEVAQAQGFGYNTVAAAVAAAKVLNLNVDQIRHAIGMAGYLTPVPCIPKWLKSPPLGIMKYQEMGWFASTGMQAAFMARLGYTGDTLLLDDCGDYSYWKAYGMLGFSFDGMVNDLGKSWGIMQMGIKPSPCCRWFHTPIQLFRRIMDQNDLEPEDITAVRISVPLAVYSSKAHNAGNWADWKEKDAVHSQYNLPYCIALTAYNVPAGPQWQMPHTLNDPLYGEYSRRVSLTLDEQCLNRQADYLLSGQPKGRVMTQVHYTVEVDSIKGSFVSEGDYIHGESYEKEHALMKEELKDKFRAQAVFEQAGRENELIEKIYALDQFESIGGFMACFKK